MKLLVKELEHITKIDQQIDLSEFITKVEDLIALNHVIIKGSIYKKVDEIKVELSVDLEVIQKCTISLLPVDYKLSFDTELIFSKDEEVFDYILTDEIDLGQVIFAEILLNKEPYVYHDEADQNKFLEPEKLGHPAFKDLKKES